jgi:hypothetical protein
MQTLNTYIIIASLLLANLLYDSAILLALYDMVGAFSQQQTKLLTLLLLNLLAEGAVDCVF